jgi:site-specific DNA-methyltransferase (adenine-specific)
MGMNALRKRGGLHASEHLARRLPPDRTRHAVVTADCLDLLGRLPDQSVQLVICDPPYNLQLACWDHYPDYLSWASGWLREAERVLAPTGNLVLFGGLQYQAEAGSGDLLTLVCAMRQSSAMQRTGRPALFRQPPRGDRLVRQDGELLFRSGRGTGTLR